MKIQTIIFITNRDCSCILFWKYWKI